jgi:hypothetical protein
MIPRLHIPPSLPVAVLLTWLALLLVRPAGAFDRLELDIGALSAPDWRAEQVRFTLEWSDFEKTGYGLEIGRLEFPALEQSISGVKIICRGGEIDGRRIACAEGEVLLPHPLLDTPTMALSFELERSSGKLAVRLQGIHMAGGTLDLAFDLAAGGWSLSAKGRGLELDSIARHWPAAGDPLQGWSLAGRVDLEGRASGRAGELQKASWKGALSDLSLGDADGRYVGEGLAAGFSGKLAHSKTTWRVDSGLTLKQGELLTPVCYLDAAAYPLSLQGSLQLDAGFDTLQLRHVRLQQTELLDLELQGDLRLSGDQPLQQLQLRAKPLQAGRLYREVVQPVLAGTPWGRFEMAGELDLALELQDQQLSLELGLQDFNLDDAEAEGATRRLGLYGANGRLYWSRGGALRTSHLSWQAGHLLEHVDIGPARIDFEANDDHFRLSQEARIPLLDGTLVVNRLDLAALGKPAQRLQFDGFIEPISMGSLSRALGWRPLSGKLSGMIPGVTYESGLLSVDGVLLVRMFDGDVLIRELKSRDLFGVYPQLSADIELRNLELESLTDTFSFGRITGRLDGYVRDLSLEDWTPVTFDARFHTPEKDDSRHRISQRAVDNISNLGGAGLSGSLARSFLGFFKEFNYKRIGIGCRLQDGVCDMSGAGKAKQGYYLVEGSGIPRIDIIGFNTTADWSRLVEQLKQITTTGAPVIQ